MNIIDVKNLSKNYNVYIRETGFLKSIKSMFVRKYKIKEAVKDISFSIGKGELVGYIGQNGAGKSTTIKMMSGILTPTSGEVLVMDKEPYKNRQENAMHIGAVFGQRSQLYWELPMDDTLSLFKKMYRIDDNVFKENVGFYTEMLDMKSFFKTPIRQLSLGQKMRVEFMISMLHNPKILYLDEPTIGLDIIAKARIREFIKMINKERETTVILTTHDMDDIEQICDRLILIDEGKLLFDGKLDDFKKQYAEDSMIEFIYNSNKNNNNIDTEGIDIIDIDDGKKIATFNANTYTSAQVAKMIMDNYDIIDLSIKHSNLEDILKRIY